MKYTELKLTDDKNDSMLYCYEHTDFPELPVDKRRAILVIPGGGYGMCSDREGEPIALDFFNRGYNAYVLKYPCAPVRFPAQLVAAAHAMDTIRARAAQTKTDKRKVFATGFSAGGHLCANLANCPRDFAAVKKYDFKPDGIALGYPVIGGTPTHGGSFENLLGGMPEGETAWLDLHTSVLDDNPPAFIWTTANDDIVPAVNSLKYAMAYCNKGLKYELHVFRDGPHGLSLADDRTNCGNPGYLNPKAANWVDFADEFLRSI